MEDVTVVHRVQPYAGSATYLTAQPHPCLDAGEVGVARRMRHGTGWGFEAMLAVLLSAAPNGSLFLDVGANIGAYTLWPAALGQRVVSVEVGLPPPQHSTQYKV